MILKNWHAASETQPYEGYINNDTRLITTYFMARSYLVAYMFEWGKTGTKSFNEETLQQRTKLTE